MFLILGVPGRPSPGAPRRDQCHRGGGKPGVGRGPGARPTLSLPAPGGLAATRTGGAGRLRAGPRYRLPLVGAVAQRRGHLFPSGQPSGQSGAALSRWRPGGGAGEVEGWGECPALPGPTFSAEYTAGAQDVSERYLVPALCARGGLRCRGGARPGRREGPQHGQDRLRGGRAGRRAQGRRRPHWPTFCAGGAAPGRRGRQR